MNYLIIDLECTCDDNDSFDRSKMETIEIGAVLVNDNLEKIEEFSQFVKPTINPILTDFCKNLTTITQEDVDNAPMIEDALKSLSDFCQEHGEYTFVSWGGFDYRQIKRETKLKELENPMVGRNINYKDVVKKVTGEKATSITKTLRKLGGDFSGTQHRGIDDALNIYEIIKILKI